MEVLATNMSDFAKFLQEYVTSNDAWVYLLTSVTGVISTTLIMVGRKEIEILKIWQKVSRFFGFLLFACVLSILLDNNKFIALGIGVATPFVYFDFVKKFLATLESLTPFGTGKATKPKGTIDDS